MHLILATTMCTKVKNKHFEKRTSKQFLIQFYEKFLSNWCIMFPWGFPGSDIEQSLDKNI